jgi:hypothetical protein
LLLVDASQQIGKGRSAGFFGSWFGARWYCNLLIVKGRGTGTASTRSFGLFLLRRRRKVGDGSSRSGDLVVIKRVWFDIPWRSVLLVPRHVTGNSGGSVRGGFSSGLATRHFESDRITIGGINFEEVLGDGDFRLTQSSSQGTGSLVGRGAGDRGNIIGCLGGG